MFCSFHGIREAFSLFRRVKQGFRLLEDFTKINIIFKKQIRLITTGTTQKTESIDEQSKSGWKQSFNTCSRCKSYNVWVRSSIIWLLVSIFLLMSSKVLWIPLIYFNYVFVFLLVFKVKGSLISKGKKKGSHVPINHSCCDYKYHQRKSFWGKGSLQFESIH